MPRTQKEKVIQHILDTGAIDNFWSIDTRTSVRLGAIMHVLEEEGWKFDKGFIEGTKNYQYKLVEAPEIKLF